MKSRVISNLDSDIRSYLKVYFLFDAENDYSVINGFGWGYAKPGGGEVSAHVQNFKSKRTTWTLEKKILFSHA